MRKLAGKMGIKRIRRIRRMVMLLHEFTIFFIMDNFYGCLIGLRMNKFNIYDENYDKIF